ALAPTYTASTVSASSRALVRISRVALVGLSPSDSAKTQILETATALSYCSIRISDDLQLLEELDDALIRLAVVLDLLAGLALVRGADVHDLLPRTGPADLPRVEPEVGHGHLVDGLVLRRHDPLERRVAGFDHTGGHAHDRGQRCLDLVVAGLGLALDG